MSSKSLLDDTRKYSGDAIINGIYKSFMSIEKQDLKVKQIRMPRKFWYQLMADPKCFFIMQPLSSIFFTGTQSVENITAGKIWGTDVCLDDSFQVVSEERRLPWPNHLGIQACSIIEHVILIDPIIEKIKGNLYIIVKSRANPIYGINEAENKAIQTLREMITESEYRRYIKYGFILVPGKNGSIYQIYRGTGHTKVWKDGKKIEEICVQITDRHVPPTDNVIARKIMVEENEDAFRKCGNIYKFDRNDELVAAAA